MLDIIARTKIEESQKVSFQFLDMNSADFLIEKCCSFALWCIYICFLISFPSGGGTGGLSYQQFDNPQEPKHADQPTFII